MGAPKARPVSEKRGGGGSRPEEMSQQMTDFGSGQRDERGAGRRLRRWGRSREVVVDRDAQEEGRSEQDQSDVAIPAHVAAYFILVKSQNFASVQVLFDVPTAANGLH